MQRMLPSLLVSVTMALGLALAATPVKAGDPAVCAVYAASAVAQQKKNKNLGCGFVGPRWSKNYGGHYAWCLTAPNAAIQGETNARDNMLANCQGGGPVTKTYPDPKIQGVRLDWCYKWGTECGAPAAKAFCVSKGLPLVKGFAKAENIGVYTKTKVFSSGQICAAPECDGFTYIKCGK